MERKCKNCYSPLTLGQTECPNCGTLNYLPEGTQNEQGVTLSYANNPNDYPMRWFKFVIYVQLFLNCVLNLVSGISALNGTQYLQAGTEPALVYGVFPALKTADTVYGYLLIALAIFAIIIRFRLSGFHSDGPTLYLAHLGVQMVVAVVYVLMAINALQPEDPGSLWIDILPDLIANGILLICNAVYFKKRRPLFCY